MGGLSQPPKGPTYLDSSLEENPGTQHPACFLEVFVRDKAASGPCGVGSWRPDSGVRQSCGFLRWPPLPSPPVSLYNIVESTTYFPANPPPKSYFKAREEGDGTRNGGGRVLQT